MDLLEEKIKQGRATLNSSKMPLESDNSFELLLKKSQLF